MIKLGLYRLTIRSYGSLIHKSALILSVFIHKSALNFHAFQHKSALVFPAFQHESALLTSASTYSPYCPD